MVLLNASLRRTVTLAVKFWPTTRIMGAAAMLKVALATPETLTVTGKVARTLLTPRLKAKGLV